jgi:hypothetical protein
VDFDPETVSYEELLELALTSHDPMRPAYKEQYASLVLTHDEAQLATARAVAGRRESVLGSRLATRIEPLKRFYYAEDYHQKYYLRSDRTLASDFNAIFGDEQSAFRESTAAARVNGYAAGAGAKSRLLGEIELLGLSDRGLTHLISRVKDDVGRPGCAIG